MEREQNVSQTFVGYHVRPLANSFTVRHGAAFSLCKCTAYRHQVFDTVRRLDSALVPVRHVEIGSWGAEVFF